jgi:uncharacterized repeat protein (TIGR01451 family)
MRAGSAVVFVRIQHGPTREVSAMHAILKRSLALALVAGAFCVPAAAHADGTVRVTLTAQHVTTTNGREKLESAEKARPGDVIEYRAIYLNDGATAVRQMMATLPIPVGMEYLPSTALPATAQASLDGRTFAPVPLVRKQRLPDGRVTVQEVPASEYRALRWPIGALGAKESRSVVARVRVAPVAVAALTR